jgi:lysozyme
MQVNARGVALIKAFESCRLTAYRDGGGVLTIGWGHTGGVKPGDTITQAEADELFERDLCIREVTLTRLLEGVPTTSNQFAALCSLAYNVGFGDPNRSIPGLRTSTVLKRHKLGNHLGASRAFVMWNRDNGKVVRGLTRRREAEAALYLEPDAAPILRPIAPVAPVEAPPAPVAPAPVSDSQIAANPAAGCLMALLAIIGAKR